ncbi:DNA-binding transcriptional regulator [Erwinia endophytica]|uniref:XylR family transcriptional regulator n=1 Tax=Erwinia endophytica TaxID=1563158 RepID=UPI001265D89A|nr:DNA-binding transcriptional regulator [Erwinia endophytica]KAB8307945.1 DNA-binding transcriptional regulator [Erwinia endophytica]
MKIRDCVSSRQARISLLFNANKAYDRQIIEGIGEYFHLSQCDWDIYIEEDFSVRHLNDDILSSSGIIADFDDETLAAQLSRIAIPVVGVGGSYSNHENYPPVSYVATDNEALVAAALNHLLDKGIERFAFYGLPAQAGKHWAQERAAAFLRLTTKMSYPAMVYEGMVTGRNTWETAQQKLAEWLHSLPDHTGIIAVTDARARHVLQTCEYSGIAVPESVCVMGIDNEELTRYLSRISLSSVVQGTRTMGFEAAKLLDALLSGRRVSGYPVIVPPERVIARQSTDYRSIIDAMVVRAMWFIRKNACRGITVGDVLESVGTSRSNLDKKFMAELGMTIHKVIHDEKFARARELLETTTLPIAEISRLCGYNTPQYFCTLFQQKLHLSPVKYRNIHGALLASGG